MGFDHSIYLSQMLQQTTEMIKIFNFENYIAGRKIFRGSLCFQLNDIGVIHTDSITDCGQHAFFILYYQIDLGPMNRFGIARPTHFNPALGVGCQEIMTISLMD
jgi:hypothetical protein